MHYLHHIRQVWLDLVGGDEGALQLIDQRTVNTLELMAPGTSTADANKVRPMVIGGQVFGAFSKPEHEQILARLVVVDGLIPSLRTFFSDIDYLKDCVDCVKRLISVPQGIENTVSSSLRHALRRVPAQGRRIVVQIAEDRFATLEGNRADRIDLHIRQLYAFAMRHHPDMPPDPQKVKRAAKPRARADPALLRRFADLATRLGFKSGKITQLLQHSASTTVQPDRHKAKPYLVTPGPALSITERCGSPSSPAYRRDRDFLFIHNMHDERRERGEAITSFYARRSTYLAFFGKANPIRIDAATSFPAPDIRQNQDSPLPRDTDESRVSTPPRSQGFNGPGADSLARDESGRAYATPEPLGQDVENIVAMYEVADEYRDGPQVVDAMEEDEQAEDGVERPSDLRQDPVSWMDQGTEQSETQDELHRAHEEDTESGVEQVHEPGQHQDIEEGEQEGEEESAQEFDGDQDRELEPELEGQAQEVDLGQVQHMQEVLEHTADRNTFTRIQDNLSSWIQEWEPRQLDDQPASSPSDSLQQQPGPAEEANPQANDQWESDTEAAERESVSTPRSPPQDTSSHQPVRESGTRTESTYSDLTPQQPVFEPTPPQRQTITSNKVCIKMKIKHQGAWRDMQPLMVDPSNTSVLERAIDRYLRDGIRPLNTQLGILPSRHCFASITGDGTNTVLLLPDRELILEGEMVEDASRFHAEATAQPVAGHKRPAEEDISQLNHARKMRPWH